MDHDRVTTLPPLSGASLGMCHAYAVTCNLFLHGPRLERGVLTKTAMSLLLGMSLLLFDDIADDPLCLLQDQQAGHSQGMVFVWNFGFDGDAGLLKFNGGRGDQRMSVRGEI